MEESVSCSVLRIIAGTTSEVQLSVLEALVLNEKRRMLQETLTNSSQAKELSILDPDRDA